MAVYLSKMAVTMVGSMSAPDLRLYILSKNKKYPGNSFHA